MVSYSGPFAGTADHFGPMAGFCKPFFHKLLPSAFSLPDGPRLTGKIWPLLDAQQGFLFFCGWIYLDLPTFTYIYLMPSAI
jgi:hypothetical protein